MADTPLTEILINGVVDNLVTNLDEGLEKWHKQATTKLLRAFLQATESIFRVDTLAELEVSFILLALVYGWHQADMAPQLMYHTCSGRSHLLRSCLAVTPAAQTMLPGDVMYSSSHCVQPGVKALVIPRIK